MDNKNNEFICFYWQFLAIIIIVKKREIEFEIPYMHFLLKGSYKFYFFRDSLLDLLNKFLVYSIKFLFTGQISYLQN